MDSDRDHPDHPISILTHAIPGRWRELRSMPEVPTFEIFRPVLSLSAPEDFRDIMLAVGYDIPKVQSAYDSTFYPLGMNPLDPSTLKPEIWLEATQADAKNAVDLSHRKWLKSMPDLLSTAKTEANFMDIAGQADNPFSNVDKAELIRLKDVLAARFAFDSGNKTPAALFIHGDEEDAAKQIYQFYKFEAEKSPPGEKPALDAFCYTAAFPGLFEHAKRYAVLRGLRRACGVTDAQVEKTWNFNSDS